MLIIALDFARRNTTLFVFALLNLYPAPCHRCVGDVADTT